MAAVPRPGGRPRPSGSTSISIAFSSPAAGVRPTPKAGDCATAAVTAQSVTAARAAILRAVAIADLAICRDFPDLNAVGVGLRVRASDLDEFGECRLRVTGFVGAARRDAGFAA